MAKAKKTAKKIVREKKAKGDGPGGGLRVKHVTNALAQIELWIGAVRAALAGLPPEQELTVAPGSKSRLLSPIQVKHDCAPPSIRTEKKTR